jgi:ribonuclease BN (tRNA processing enzyme)
VIGPFAVTASHVAHPVETFAFRFEHGGHTLTYSGDTGESPTLVELARSADVLLCEAGFPDLPDLPPNLHLCGRQAGQHAARAGAGRLVLTHLAPDIDPARSLAAAAGAFGGAVSLAAPGQVLDLD